MRRLILWSSVLCVAAIHAQEANDVEQLKRQLREWKENSEKTQLEFQKTQQLQREQIEALTRKLDDLTKQQGADAEKKKLEQQLAAELQAPTTNAPAAPWSPAQ